MAVAGTEDTFSKKNITVKIVSWKQCNNKREVATVFPKGIVCNSHGLN